MANKIRGRDIRVANRPLKGLLVKGVTGLRMVGSLDLLRVVTTAGSTSEIATLRRLHDEYRPFVSPSKYVRSNMSTKGITKTFHHREMNHIILNEEGAKMPKY